MVVCSISATVWGNSVLRDVAAIVVFAGLIVMMARASENTGARWIKSPRYSFQTREGRARVARRLRGEREDWREPPEPPDSPPGFEDESFEGADPITRRAWRKRQRDA